MRASLAFALLLSFASIALSPSASADATFTDPAGDVVAHPAGATVPDNAQAQATDIVGLDVVEGDHDWTFTLSLASFGQQGGTINTYTTDFTWDDATYRVSILRSRFDPSSEPLLRAQLQLADGERFNKIIDLDVVEEGSALAVRFEKLYVASLGGHAPVPGSELTNVVVTSRGDLNFGSVVPVQLTDILEAPESIVYTKGGSASGHIVLEPANPVRISNGGSGTFVYTVHVQNLGETEDTVELSVADIPDGWTTRVHPSYLIPPQEEAPVVIIATLPFGHTHGGFSAFTLNAKSLRDPAATASVKLGVVHTPIPQPAGHHGELYLHAAPADSGTFQTAFPGTINTMNTLADHADDQREAFPDRDLQGGPEQGPPTWRFNLGPQLAMGLDFDLNRTGTVTGQIIGRTTGAAELAAELWLILGDEDKAQLATAPPASLTLDLQNPSDFAFTLTPTPESDYVAYAPGQNLQLRLALTTETPCCPPGSSSSPAILVEGFEMTLPLNEYHEAPVINEEGREIIATLEATPDGPVEKQARPGATTAFAYRIKNGGDERVAFRIEPEGTGKDALTVLPGLEGSLAPGETQRILLGVKVPVDANDGEILEGVLVIRSKADPANLVIARTSTVVSTTTDAKDESDILAAAQGGGDRGVPTPGAVLLGLSLLATALLARRRKR